MTKVRDEIRGRNLVKVKFMNHMRHVEYIKNKQVSFAHIRHCICYFFKRFSNSYLAPEEVFDFISPLLP